MWPIRVVDVANKHPNTVHSDPWVEQANSSVTLIEPEFLTGV